MNGQPTPKQAEFYMPAEWHKHKQCWMAWPCHQATWAKVGLERARKVYARVAQAIAELEPVTILANPEDVTSAQLLCGKSIEVVPFALNDSWTRDTGATFLLQHKTNALAGIDWIHNAWGGNYLDCELDNKIANFMIQQQNARYFHAPLVMEGGSFHVDGEGTLLTTRECLLNPNRNPHLNQEDIENFLCQYLGIDKILWLNRGLFEDETDGHVDEIACFVAPGRVLALTTSDKQDINYAVLKENFESLKTMRDASGRPLEVIPIEQPPEVSMNGQRLTLSYVNFYKANGGLVMPAFGAKAYDDKALGLMKELFPQERCIQVQALDLFAGGGGIHCITQQQPL